MSQYTAEDIEVLTGLEPVRKRPGMYTDTTRPNHLAQEVIDNSVDEALAGHASQIDVSLNKDGSVTVGDNGRGMPVDLHPEQGKPGVEVILSTLHAGGKFSDKNYQFSGGLHGVGVSVVNALSSALEILIRRDGNVYRMTFAGGEKKTDLEVVDTCGKRNTGTSLTFTPDPQYFDSVNFSISRLKHVLRAKAVLCPGLRVKFKDEKKSESEEWYYEDGLTDYLADATIDYLVLPEEPFVGSFSGSNEGVDWAVQWLPEGGEVVAESYVNLIPTAQGGTHVNGMRTGLLDACANFASCVACCPGASSWHRMISGIAAAMCSLLNWAIPSSPARPRSACHPGRRQRLCRASPRMPSASGYTSTRKRQRSWRRCVSAMPRDACAWPKR